MKKAVLVLLLLVVGLVCGVAGWSRLLRANASEYRVFESPDSNFKVVVYRIPEFHTVFPGQAGDAAGYIRLYDKAGVVLAEKDVEMVNSVDQVYWEKDSVDVKLVGVWTLPPQK
ncbi:MAG TPA: hypothetical protein VF527_12285 [Pyrinomonadaceae bacterium]|jgi:hypothetical protein